MGPSLTGQQRNKKSRQSINWRGLVYNESVSKNTIRIGAHLSSAEGFSALFAHANEIGANTLQLFSTSPRIWKPSELKEEDVRIFRELSEKLDIDPIYFHASYLINLASEEATGERSKTTLINELHKATLLGVRGSIVHTGSFKGGKEDYWVVVGRIQEILDSTPEETLLILENSGNRKIGLKLEELGEIIKEVGSSRVRVCLDTCHLHAAGYDIQTKEKLDEFMKHFDTIIGLNRLEVWHINDSRDSFGSFRDRHENIGEGFINKNVFRLLVNNPQTQNIPFIIETPGFDRSGPDKKNLDILKSFIE